MKNLDFDGLSLGTIIGIFAASFFLLIGFTHAGSDGHPKSTSILLNDDFSGSLGTNWIAGTNSNQNSSGPTVAIVDQQLVFSQRYDYIETKRSFDGDFEISFDVMRKAGSHPCADYYVELVSVGAPAGMMRFRYGTDAKESINLGTPPTRNTTKNRDCIRDPKYLRELNHSGRSEGRLLFELKDNRVQLSYTDDEGNTISTPWVSAGSFDSTKVRIWGFGGNGSERYIDNILITTDSATESTIGLVSDGSCKILITDDFSGSLSKFWTTGTNTLQNPNGPTVSVIDEQLVFAQHYDYIETKSAFSGDFAVSFDIFRKAGSHQCADYYIELVNVRDIAGIMRFRYGTDAKESINLGTPPTRNTTKNWDCIRDPKYLRELNHKGASKGEIKLEFKGSRIQLSYTNNEGETITTSWVSTGSSENTKVRIWGLGGKGSPRYLDNVVIARPEN